MDDQQHRALVRSACDRAEAVLPLFELERSSDTRPRRAIEAGRAWADGALSIHEARLAAFASHAAARDALGKAAIAAARSAGHAAATAHVASHARHADAYARKAELSVPASPDGQE